MKIVHIAAHLGGGVGKAHAAVCGADQPETSRHYLLLEEPRDTRFVEAIRGTGATVTLACDVPGARHLIENADVVQVEWWNHPRLYQYLCGGNLPASRMVFWSHISGLHAPCIPPALLTAPHRFLFTSACSLEASSVQRLPVEARPGVVNSGFGFGTGAVPNRNRAVPVGYLGTVDFSKLSPQFFEVTDRAEPDQPVAIWGDVDAEGEVRRQAAAMKRRDAVRFCGHADDPEAALRQTGIFLYLLQPRHFGTAENALIEAMSLGCVPLVFDNPAERAIVEHGRTGFIEPDATAAAKRLQWMLRNPDAIEAMGQQAAAAMVATRTPKNTAEDLAAVYRSVMGQAKRKIDFAGVLGSTPADWFLSTQEAGIADDLPAGTARKGTLAHFAHCFPGDASLDRLRARMLLSQE